MIENKFLTAAEVAENLGISKPYAYKIIRRLNQELEAKGFMTIAGKINRRYLEERFYNYGKEDN